ncbi:hypothetical protein BGZ73_008599 [Actinomortierella ambigua]|nr:hypothetical protein BGZ73_008599 [Actinomortierella ambigua]
MSEKFTPTPAAAPADVPPQYPSSGAPMPVATPPQAYPGAPVQAYPGQPGYPPHGAPVPPGAQMPATAQYAYPPGAQPPNGAPVYVVRRDYAAIERYQQEIKENEIGCSDIFWFICCGPFALICCLPKYNRQQELRRQIDIELAKPV